MLATLLKTEYTDPGGVTPLHRNVYLQRQLSFTGLLLSVPGGALHTPVAAFSWQPFHPLGPQRGNVNLLKAHSTKGVSYRDQKGTWGGGEGNKRVPTGQTLSCWFCHQGHQSSPWGSGEYSVPSNGHHKLLKDVSISGIPIDPTPTPEGSVLPLLPGAAGFREKVLGLLDNPSQRS